MTVRDKIVRSILLPASIDRAWHAISEPEHIRRWFGADIEGDLRPGGLITFRMGRDEQARALIDSIDPPRRFSYRWHPGSVQHLDRPLIELPLTLVEFNLEELADGTLLTLIESGFATLPSDIFDRCWRENTEGWEIEIGHLAAYLAGQPEV